MKANDATIKNNPLSVRIIYLIMALAIPLLLVLVGLLVFTANKQSRDLSNVGTYLLGAAAVIAALQTNDILSKIIGIQEKSDQIDTGIKEIKSAVNQLRDEVKMQRAIRTVVQFPKNPSIEEIEKVLRTIPNYSMSGEPTIILPPAHLSEIAKKLHMVQSTEEQAFLLKNSLEYIPSKE